MFEECISEIQLVQNELARTLYRKFKDRNQFIYESSNDQLYKGPIKKVEKRLYKDRENIKTKFLSFEVMDFPNIEIRYEIDRYDIRPQIIFIGDPSLLRYENMTNDQQEEYIELSRELDKLFNRISSETSSTGAVPRTDKSAKALSTALTNDINIFIKKFESTGYEKPEKIFTLVGYSRGERYY